MQLVNPGDILIAKPFLQDNYFKRSVIYMVEHSESGSLGFIVNKPNHLKLKDVLPHLKHANFPLFEGGPVSIDQLFYTHTLGSKLSNSIEISEGVYWGGNFFELSILIENRELDENDIRFYIGYSGWSAHQIETEIERDKWFVQSAEYKSIISAHSDDLWGDELIKINAGFKAFSDFNFDPSLN